MSRGRDLFSLSIYRWRRARWRARSDHGGAQGEVFWRTHHEAWKRSDLNQRQYCEAEGIPLKAFGNWRAKFKAEPQPPERKLPYRRRGLSPPLSPPFSHLSLSETQSG
ncbi:IS66 family insertion sequence element accessory protein TnpA [Bradyrhizobium sp. AZCC 2289]|uniref:IS66 family insertion sequence element accessory protein TnpA n=1 Tax=Bradyrhizobium sp. AZCC 2289 TaxID=3117026 RepID=UPI003FA60B35